MTCTQPRVDSAESQLCGALAEFNVESFDGAYREPVCKAHLAATVCWITTGGRSVVATVSRI